jgi:hypothetical protein
VTRQPYQTINIINLSRKNKRWSGARHVTVVSCFSLKLTSSPYINRFLSADTAVPNPLDPQALNRYSYVLGNPLRYTDPTGHICVNNNGTDDEAAMSGDCHGGENPLYTGGLVGSPVGYTGGGSGGNNNSNPSGGTPSPTSTLTPTPQPQPVPTPEPFGTPMPWTTIVTTSSTTTWEINEFNSDYEISVSIDYGPLPITVSLTVDGQVYSIVISNETTIPNEFREVVRTTTITTTTTTYDQYGDPMGVSTSTSSNTTVSIEYQDGNGVWHPYNPWTIPNNLAPPY